MDNRQSTNVVPFIRPWHVIQEIDVVPLVVAHRRRIDLCAHLEGIADALPISCDDDDDVAIAHLRRMALDRKDAPAILDRLLACHGEDRLGMVLLDHVRLHRIADCAAADELAAALLPPEPRGLPVAAETLGHMLRGFFTACRWGVRLEQLTLIALAGHRLTPDARALLIDALADGLLD